MERAVAGGSVGGRGVTADRTVHSVSFTCNGRGARGSVGRWGGSAGFVLFQRRLKAVRGIAWSVNSVAPGRKGSGTRGDDRSIKYVVVVVV